MSVRRMALLGGLLWIALAGGTGVAGTVDAVPRRVVIDPFEDVTPWSAQPSDGVELAIAKDAGVHGAAMRLDFRFVAGAGYAVARRAVDLDLPVNYRLRFAVRGTGPDNDLELKLIDSTGANVWWCNRRAFHFPAGWDSLSTRKRQIEFAWGPAGGGEIRHVAAIEIAITAGKGGTGSVWLDDFTLEALPPPDATPPQPRASASSEEGGQEAARAADGNAATAWRSRPGDRLPWFRLDLGVVREFGGLVIDWAKGRHASDYAIEGSEDGVAWRRLARVRRGNGGTDWIRLPESEARQVRIRTLGGGTALGIREVTLEPLAWGATLENFYRAIAAPAAPGTDSAGRAARRGTYPRAIGGEQAFWSVVGLDRDAEEALLGEDGALEVGKGRFSIEPFLLVDGRLVTWADVRSAHTLQGGDLPLPAVRWDGAVGLEITALPGGSSGHSTVTGHYRIRNDSPTARRVSLLLAVRPFQVNPPSQFLNTRGGWAPVHAIARPDARRVRVDAEELEVDPPAAAFGAAEFDEGDVVADHLRAGRIPARTAVYDSSGRASAVLRWDWSLPAGEERAVAVTVHRPPGPGAAAAAAAMAGAPRDSRAAADSPSIAEARRPWEERLAPVRITLPGPAAEALRTLRAQLGWILVNRDGAAIQPGSRSYERSWIRDGALTSSALLRLGAPDVVRDYIDWFAGYLFPNGKVPCCVDARGADPVPEHDSHGEFIYLVAEYHRYTGDRALVERHWPAVLGAAHYLDSLRQTRRTAEWRTPANAAFFGILPPSISHEGYSAKPMHSYWDDFFALRGFKDAEYLAAVLGDARERSRIGGIRIEFERDLSRSVRAALALHRIDYVPGCADLGDFDATSTTIALAPAGAEPLLPAAALRRTFEKYWEFFRARRDGGSAWEAFTPYELRNLGAFVRLGWRDRAGELLDWFLTQRTPTGWAQWAEVVAREKRSPRFLGDLPHTWVGSDYVRSVLDMLAYERESDRALVIAAGVPWKWTAGGGVTVEGLPTPHGPLTYSLRALADTVTVEVGPGVRVPPGGVVILPPARSPFRSVSVDGRPAPLSAGGVVIRQVPATVLFRP